MLQDRLIVADDEVRFSGDMLEAIQAETPGGDY